MKYENEEQIRKDFARIFRWYSHESEYGCWKTNEVLKTPEWSEIFAEVGRLMVRLDWQNINNQMEDWDNRIGMLEKKVEDIQFPLNKINA